MSGTTCGGLSRNQTALSAIAKVLGRRFFLDLHTQIVGETYQLDITYLNDLAVAIIVVLFGPDSLCNLPDPPEMPTGGPRPKYAESVRQTVEACLRAGVEVNQIAQEVYVSHQWVSFLRQNLDAFDTVSPATLSVQGRPRKITREAEEGILDFIEQNPTAYQDEIAEFLLSEYNIEAYTSTVCRTLKRLNQTHKRNERVCEERDDKVRADWRSRLCEYKANQIIFVDESAVNERTKDRRWGWSLRGLPCRVKQSSQRSNRWSILSVIGLNGYLDYDIIHGSFDSERFNFFIRQLLRKMTPFPGPRLVLVIDNCRTHHGDDIKEIYR
jgi:transposase